MMDETKAERQMPILWIIHRDSRMRAAIARLASADEDTVLGAPGDPLFDAAPPADVVLLGLSGLAGNFEPELQFVHRIGARLHNAAWVLLPDSREVPEARRLFDAIDAEVLPYPPGSRTLDWRLRSAQSRSRKHPLPLSQRPARDALTARFALWFADLELPGAMRAIDPHLGDISLLIRGEPGTGRGLMVRYIHTFGGTAEGALIRVACTADTDIDDIANTIRSRARTERGRTACAIWLEDVDQLALEAQRELQGWIDFAPPEDLLSTYRVRWIGTLPEGPKLEAALENALSGIAFTLPALRDRPHLIVPIATDTARSWCEARTERHRRFDDSAARALLEYTWPGNLRELEAVVVQSLSAGAANPLKARDLVYGGAPFANGNAEESTREPVSSGTEPVDSGIEPVSTGTEPVDSGIEPDWLTLSEERIELPEILAPEAAETFSLEEDSIDQRGRALVQLADAVAHEVLNPLASIRTFAQLLPTRFSDEEFRTQFAEVVNADVMRATDVANRLSAFAALGAPLQEPVDATGMLEQLLEASRSRIRERSLLVLTELDHDRPLVLADTAQLRFALESVLDQALELVPNKGDLFVASKHHHQQGLGSSLRILVRGGTAQSNAVDTSDTSPLRYSLRLAMADWVVSGQGGRFALDSAGSGWFVIVLDLPAP